MYPCVSELLLGVLLPLPGGLRAEAAGQGCDLDFDLDLGGCRAMRDLLRDG